MRPRFSLKWLLVAVTVLSVALFVLVVYPTNKAKSFAARINNGSIDPEKELPLAKLSRSKLAFTKLTDITAELVPCTWQDVFTFQRRVEVSGTTVARSSNKGVYITSAVVGVNPKRI